MKGPIQKILVSLDGSEESMTAMHYAVMLARAVGAKLHAVYVVNTRALNDLVRSRIFLEVEEAEYERDLEADADRYLKHAEKLAGEKGYPVQTHKASGTVHQELIRLVKEYDIDLLVIGELAHVRSRRDEFYGESERAVRSAPCSVLIVKDEDRVYPLFEADV